MRAGSELIFERWSDPEFQPVGQLKSHGIVTCEPDWYLTAASTDVGAWPAEKRPIRWYQRADNSQEEIEVPNVQGCDIDGSIETDARTCTITLTNQWMKTNFAIALANELGHPGFFTFDRGASQEAQSRWNHEANEWSGRLIPGALLRTYEGYGGHDKTRQEAIDDGDIFLTGVWLVDDVIIGSKSKLIELRCRDLAALLIDQPIYPPLIPPALYPLQYQRWVDSTVTINYTPKHPSPPVFGVGAPATIRYETSSADAWYGPNAYVHNHRGTDSTDGNSTTYALGVGNSGPDKPFATDYWQYSCGGAKISAIQVNCWKGGYQMFVSVMEHGKWLGDANNPIPYDFANLEAGQPGSVNTEADIPYIMLVGCPFEELFTVNLPRIISADRVRITFRHLYDSNIGPWEYRAGVREFKALATKELTAATTRPFGWQAIEAHPTLDGYWTLAYEGKVHEFGQCFHYGDMYSKTSTTYVDIVSTPDGLGYWLLDNKGNVTAFGNATHFGDGLMSSDAVAMARTYTGNGYWILYRDGDIVGYGDATPAYEITGDGQASDISSMHADYGYWVVDDDGIVTAWGAAVDYGVGLPIEILQSMASMPDDLGYLMLGGNGGVRPRGSALGSAVDVGSIMVVTDAYRPAELCRPERIAINFDASGYWVIDTSGQVYARAGANRWGSPADGVATIRRDGNYKDYSDIVKDLLLWAGFWLQETLGISDMPSVYGNIESTGIYAPDPLNPEMFDKKPLIDPIKQIREIVGYLSWVDDEGAFHFESPNWWQAGNFWSNGGHTDYIPEIDERLQLTDYTVAHTRTKDRSEIIITTDEPTAGFEDTVTTRYTPSNSRLRGMSVPAMIKVPTTVTAQEQSIMAELIALHLWFARRTGQVTCQANPAIQINDQIRLYERVTAETYIHYVRGIGSHHDFKSGVYEMTLNTNWLGTEEGSWAIWAIGDSISQVAVGTPAPDFAEQFPISQALADFLNQTAKSPSAFDVLVLQTDDIDNPPVDDGAAVVP